MRLGKLEVPHGAESPGQGMVVWRNPLNHFLTLALHYTADPDKRTPAWLALAKQGYGDAATWDQEFELDFSTWLGRPVFGSFSRAAHVAPLPLEFDPTLPVERYWDIGVHACVWAQLNRADLRLSIFNSVQVLGAFARDEARYREHEIECSGLGVFIDKVKVLSTGMFPDVRKWIDVIDPAGFYETIKHEGTSADVFRSHGLIPLPGMTQDIDVRISAVEDWLTWMSNGKPAFQIDPRAQLLIDGLAGGYAFAQDGASPKPDKKSPFSHACDGLEYGCTRLPALRPGSRLDKLQREAAARVLDPAKHDFGPKYRSTIAGTPRENWMSY